MNNNSISKERCLFYNPRHFPILKELAALYLYFDRVEVIPPAQTIFITHNLCNRFPDKCLHMLSDMIHEAEEFGMVEKTLLPLNFVATYTPTRMQLVGEVTLEFWEHLCSKKDVQEKDIEEFLNVHDSIVYTIFHAAKRDIVVSHMGRERPQLSSKGVISQCAFANIAESLPSIVSDEPSILQEVKNECQGAVASLKDFLRSEVQKFKFDKSSNTIEFEKSIARRIREYKMTFYKRIRELLEKKREIKYKIVFTGLTGLALCFASNPSVGAITSALAIHNFVQEWITLQETEQSERSQALSDTAGLFIKFDEMEEKSWHSEANHK